MNAANAYRNSAAYGAYELSMMKRTLDLAGEAGVTLRGVLTWAFTFPETPYFAGYRALATNGIHLPVLNAFKLLGSLKGDRIPVTSSGALPLDDILADGVRAEPDVDAIAVLDGDRVGVLVWNYHDDLVDAEPVPVTLTVSVPPAFTANAAITHTRVDDTHGSAYAAWLSQGSPEAPSESELAELREAMEPVVLERERVVSASGGSVRLSFSLPRHGVSLVTLTPTDQSVPAPPAPSGGGCSCHVGAPVGKVPKHLLALVALALVRRRWSGRVWIARSSGKLS
jgi:xylan 1,4-beta-xylosidase